MHFSYVFLALAVLSNIVANAIYLRNLWLKKIKPHTFTFLVWSIILGLNFFIQLFNGVEWGVAILAANFLGCVTIFTVCVWHGYIKYDWLDWVSLSLALLAILVWLLTKTPWYSVIISCFIDIFAFLPSFRKSFSRPYEDSALTFFISSLEYVFSFPSYGIFSWLVLLYPITVASLDILYAFMIWIRRYQLGVSSVK